MSILDVLRTDDIQLLVVHTKSNHNQSDARHRPGVAPMSGEPPCHPRESSNGRHKRPTSTRHGSALLPSENGNVGMRPWQGKSAVRSRIPNLRRMIDDDRGHDKAVRSLVLDALAYGRSVDDIADSLRPLHRERSPYPASVLVELAADAYLACGSSRTDPLKVDGLAERLLPEDPARGNVGHSKRRHCVQGAILIAGGAEPEDTGWWSTDDLWRHALDAVVVFVRAAAERQGTTVEALCASLRLA